MVVKDLFIHKEVDDTWTPSQERAAQRRSLEQMVNHWRETLSRQEEDLPDVIWRAEDRGSEWDCSELRHLEAEIPRSRDELAKAAKALADWVIANGIAINLTPHDINVVGYRLIAASGTVARVATVDTDGGELAGLPVISQTYGEVTGLPEALPGTYFIVSGMVRTACSDRRDLLSPGRLVRDADGQVTGCAALIRS